MRSCSILHMHTQYSDGSGSHRDIARAALRRGIDAVVVTDHNIRIGACNATTRRAVGVF